MRILDTGAIGHLRRHLVNRIVTGQEVKCGD